MQIMNPAQADSTVKDQNGISSHPNGYERTAPLSTELKIENGYRKSPEHDVYADDFTGYNEEAAKDSVAASGVHTKSSHADSIIYTDKNILESDLPELIVCYKDSTFHDVKDICVDEGMPAENKCLTENVVGGHGTLPSKNLKQTDVTEEADTNVSYEEDFKSSSYKDFKENTSADGVNEGEVNIEKNDTNISYEEDFKSSSYKDFKENASADGVNEGEVNVEKDNTNISYEEDFKPSSHKDLKENASADGVNEGEVNIEKDTAHDSNSVELKSSPESDKYQDSASVQIPTSPIQTDEECNAVDTTSEIVCDSSLSDKDLCGETSLECLLKSARGGENKSSQQTDQISGIQAQSPVMTEASSTNSLDDLLDSGVISFNVESSKLSPVTSDEMDKNAIAQQLKSEKKLVHDDGMSDNRLIINEQIKRDEGESSFAVAGPLPDIVPHSGHIPFSGSISLRSDSSTTSTRSFAFPVLPNEWNSSPVRMAKADRRNFRRRRGCCLGFLCCRF